MIESIALVTILTVAMILAIRPWLRALTGSNSGCADCPGNCGPSHCTRCFTTAGDPAEAEQATVTSCHQQQSGGT